MRGERLPYSPELLDEVAGPVGVSIEVRSGRVRWELSISTLHVMTDIGTVSCPRRVVDDLFGSPLGTVGCEAASREWGDGRRPGVFKTVLQLRVQGGSWTLTRNGDESLQPTSRNVEGLLCLVVVGEC